MATTGRARLEGRGGGSGIRVRTACEEASRRRMGAGDSSLVGGVVHSAASPVLKDALPAVCAKVPLRLAPLNGSQHLSTPHSPPSKQPRTIDSGVITPLPSPYTHRKRAVAFTAGKQMSGWLHAKQNAQRVNGSPRACSHEILGRPPPRQETCTLAGGLHTVAGGGRFSGAAVDEITADRLSEW